MPFQCHLARLAAAAQTVRANAGRIARKCSPCLLPLHLRRIIDGHRLSIPSHFEIRILNSQQRAFIIRETQELAEVFPRQSFPALLNRLAELGNVGRRHIIGGHIVRYRQVPWDNTVHSEARVWSAQHFDLLVDESPLGAEPIGHLNSISGDFVVVRDFVGAGLEQRCRRIFASQNCVVDRK